MKKGILLVLLAGCWASAAVAEPAPPPPFQDPLLDHLAGHWVVRGTMAGKNTVYDLDADWILNHQYLRLQEVSREKDAQGKPAYAADLNFAWDTTTHEYVCAFLDTYGGFSKDSIGRARSGETNKIEFVYNNPDGGGTFHATFTFDQPSNTWGLGMDLEKGGKLTPFARMKLARQ